MRRGLTVYRQSFKKEVHQTFKVTTNFSSILCRKERWWKMHGDGLQEVKQVDG